MQPGTGADTGMAALERMAPDGHSGTVAHRRRSRKRPFAKGKPGANRPPGTRAEDPRVSENVDDREVPDTARGGLCRRLGSQAWRKAAVLAGLTVGICAPYFTLQTLGVFPKRDIPETALDRVIAFAPEWTPVYLSVCLLVPLSVLSATRRDELSAFARGLTALCVTCFAGFLFFPAAGPRPGPEVIAGLSGSYPWLISIDGAKNAFPSLHAALTVFCLGFALDVLRAGPTGRGIALFWGGAILFSTLATKQHFALDIAVGGAVGAVALAWSRRTMSESIRSA